MQGGLFPVSWSSQTQPGLWLPGCWSDQHRTHRGRVCKPILQDRLREGKPVPEITPPARGAARIPTGPSTPGPHPSAVNTRLQPLGSAAGQQGRPRKHSEGACVPQLGCRPLPGVLHTCTAPAAAWPGTRLEHFFPLLLKNPVGTGILAAHAIAMIGSHGGLFARP